MAGEKETAEIYYKKALALDKKNAGAYYQLAALYASQNKNKEAITQLALAIKYGSYSKATIENDTYFTSLKAEKDFKALLQKMK